MAGCGEMSESSLSLIGENFGTAQADYAATKRDRFNVGRTCLPYNGGSGDWHIRNETEYYRFVEDAYDMERNDSVVGSMIMRRTINVIQDGFRLEPDTGDEGLNLALKDRWNDWAEDPDQCDVQREFCFHDYEMMADWTHMLAGDCGIAQMSSGELQFYEPYLIRNDYDHDIFLGVEQTENRVKYRYWIAEDYVDPYDTTFVNYSPIDTWCPSTGNRQFFHILNKRRSTISRGITCLHPIFVTTGMLDDTQFAKLAQQQIVSCVAFLFEQQLENYGFPSVGGQPAMHNQGYAEISDEQIREMVGEVQPGMSVKAPPGTKVSGFAPNIPNPGWFEQYRTLIQLVAMNIELPLNVALMDASETNFHGFIAAINEAKKLWKNGQKRLIKQFHRPCYRGKLDHFANEDFALRSARRRLGSKFYRHRWHTPIWQSVQPLQDTDNDVKRVRNAIITPSGLQNEKNVDYKTHVRTYVSDVALAVREAKKMATKVNGEFPEDQPVAWETFYPLPKPEGVQGTSDQTPKTKLTLDQLLQAHEKALNLGDNELADTFRQLIDETISQQI